MGLPWSTPLSTAATAASGTKAASHPRKKFHGLRKARCFTAVGGWAQWAAGARAAVPPPHRCRPRLVSALPAGAGGMATWRALLQRSLLAPSCCRGGQHGDD